MYNYGGGRPQPSMGDMPSVPPPPRLRETDGWAAADGGRANSNGGYGGSSNSSGVLNSYGQSDQHAYNNYQQQSSNGGGGRMENNQYVQSAAAYGSVQPSRYDPSVPTGGREYGGRGGGGYIPAPSSPSRSIRIDDRYRQNRTPPPPPILDELRARGGYDSAVAATRYDKGGRSYLSRQASR